MIKRLLLLFTLLTLAGGSLFAIPIYSISYDFGISKPLEFSGYINSIPKFDSQGGTKALQRVLITGTGTFSGDMAYENIDPEGNPGDVTLTFVKPTMTLSYVMMPAAPNISLIFAPPAYQPAAPITHANVANGDTTTFVIPTSSADAAPFDTSVGSNGALLPNFVGPGFLPLRYSSSTRYSDATEFATFSRSPNLNGTFSGTITYFYSTPEPASLALIGSGLLGLGFLLRRKAAR